MEPNWPVRRNHHLRNYDYATPGAYFITICTRVRNQSILSELVPVGAADPGGPQVRLTPLGCIVDTLIQGIPAAYPGVLLDQYVIMPDHVHLLLVLGPEGGPPGSAVPTSISKLINALKGLSTRSHGRAFWQDDYYDHIIRNDQDLEETRRYVAQNPHALAMKEEP